MYFRPQSTLPDETEHQYSWYEIDSVSHRDLSALRDIWLDHSMKDGMIAGRDLPSRKTASLLPNLLLLEPTKDHRDFYIRLAGTWTQQRFGRELKGLHVSEILDTKDFECRKAQLEQVIAQQKPIYCRSQIRQSGQLVLDSEFGIFPILASDKISKWAFVGIFYFAMVKP
jgi:hypothetical protein